MNIASMFPNYTPTPLPSSLPSWSNVPYRSAGVTKIKRRRWSTLLMRSHNAETLKRLEVGQAPPPAKDDRRFDETLVDAP